MARAICRADPLNVPGRGCVESVVTCLTHRRVERFFAIDTVGQQTIFRGPVLAAIAVGDAIRMQIELSYDDAQLLRDLLRQRVVDLDKEINRTDSLAFKDELRKLERATERVLGDISNALETTP